MTDEPPSCRWTAGTNPDSVERTGTAAQRPVGEVDGRRAVRTATELLREGGFDGLVPPTGMPRVLASRERDGRSEEVQAVWVPTSGRLALSVRWTPVVVGDVAAREALRGDASPATLDVVVPGRAERPRP